MNPQDALAQSDVTHNDRIIGRYGQAGPGPRVICVAGIHGNEPAGLYALRRVFRLLHQHHPSFEGEWVALAGNLPALAAKERFVDEDLNRIWQTTATHGVVGPTKEVSVEDRERDRLLGVIQSLLDRASDDVYFLDLHTTSAEAAPFVVISDTLKNRAFATHFPVPVVLGLEERLHGTLLEFVSDLGPVTMGVEGGQHDDPTSIDRLESAVWLALDVAGCLDLNELPELSSPRRHLEQAAKGLAHFMEIRHHHVVTRGAEFCMEPGFRNFDVVDEGQIIARDRSGPIRATENACLLLPLYQGIGADGFFLARPVQTFWLRLSLWLRSVRADLLISGLPGVRPNPADPDSFIVDRQVARWLTAEVFHLLGYRRIDIESPELVVTRRDSQQEGALRSAIT